MPGAWLFIQIWLREYLEQELNTPDCLRSSYLFLCMLADGIKGWRLNCRRCVCLKLLSVWMHDPSPKTSQSNIVWYSNRKHKISGVWLFIQIWLRKPPWTRIEYSISLFVLLFFCFFGSAQGSAFPFSFLFTHYKFPSNNVLLTNSFRLGVSTDLTVKTDEVWEPVFPW